MTKITTMAEVLERAKRRELIEFAKQGAPPELYGIGPMMIHDLPMVRAHNRRMRQMLMDREEAYQLARAVADLADELAVVG